MRLEKEGRAMILCDLTARLRGGTARLLTAATVLCLAGASIAAASILQIQPSTASVAVGGIVNLDVRISGLGAFSSPSLGVFDFTINVPGQFGAASPSFGDPV